MLRPRSGFGARLVNLALAALQIDGSFGREALNSPDLVSIAQPAVQNEEASLVWEAS